MDHKVVFLSWSKMGLTKIVGLFRYSLQRFLLSIQFSINFIRQQRITTDNKMQ